MATRKQNCSAYPNEDDEGIEAPQPLSQLIGMIRAEVSESHLPDAGWQTKSDTEKGQDIP